MGPLTKALTYSSLLAALSLEAWIGSREWPRLAPAALAAALATMALVRVRPRLAAQAVCVTAYLMPVVFTALLGRFRLHHLIVWMAAASGLIVATPGASSWAFPRRWRFPLIAWAVMVSVAWPLVALREYDFLPFELDRFRLGNSGSGGHPRHVSLWIADVAAVHLLGFFWLDWLFRRFRQAGLDAFRCEVALPLALGALLGAALAIYQGLVDVSFLSGGLWPSVGRAAGSLLDGNASGMIAALWTAGLIALLHGERRGIARSPAAVAYAALCLALWMSGSRTAFAAALVVLASTAFALARPGDGGLRGVRWKPLAAAIVVSLLAVAGLARLPAVTETPLQRIRDMARDASPAALRAAARELWDRNRYGTASARMIADYPLFGVGFGAAHLLVTDYAERVTGVRVPPDNAQNWFRHELAELGLIGSAGWIAWCGVLLHLLAATRGQGGARVPAAALKGALVAFGLISLVGVPAQSLAVTLTFWTFVFWYAALAVPDRTLRGEVEEPVLRRLAWAGIVAIVVVHSAGTLYHARRDLRVPNRAATFGWNYRYGAYPDEQAPGIGAFRWTGRRAVFVLSRQAPSLRVTTWIGHPDAERNPVRVRVRVDGALVLDERRSDAAPVSRDVPLDPAHARVVLEADVSRTWRPALYQRTTDDRELGVAVSWTFSDGPARQ